MRLLMTRPRAASEDFVAALDPWTRARVEVIHAPLLEIRALPVGIDTTGVRGLIFTSPNGVAAAAQALSDRDLPCHCVGPATTEAARAAGWRAHMAGGTAEELIADLSQQRPDAPLLHLRGEHARVDVAVRLSRAGLPARSQAVYAQTLLPLAPEAQRVLQSDVPVAAPLFSPRTARQFADQAAVGAPLWLAAISDATAEPLVPLAARHLLVAERPDGPAMGRAVEKLVKLALRVEGEQVAH
ncbi:uroporphyrinogen-III synthase [Cribrihabitans marinus]|uniref:Uroporphyrinogen-III synthase n=1 Tax=Cribrihabitans marinus TaxID=1227549 RepID=A0A1H6YY42_9RHOB|nr:uroporphyrinogen-III synthase [Cribrihabitans marinus]GGH29390.1 uroporphyrinogen III methyltransferase [Cribrihabitans marinus]SEJ41635.1 uroporphyrinogen-III synthase [Cribrihabitans marinus]